MRAVVMEHFGGPEGAQVADVPDAPAPGAGQVRVTVGAAAVGPVDCQVRSGSKGDELTAAEAVARFEAGGVRGKVGLAGGTDPARHTEAGLRFTLTGR